ncbi:MAG: MMPL family transporter, partial [Polyangia bacterium]|nr:MMPL family transporter [Polyangia bacterium]
IERRLGRPDTLPGGLWPRLAWVGATTAAGLGAMTAVLFMLFVNPGIGVGLLGAYCLLFVLAPQLFLGGQRASIASPAVAAPGGGLPWLGDIVLLIARRRVLLLLAAAALTAGALFLGQKVSARFDVKEFFSPDSDFVVGLDRFDRHFGARSGEPALIYIEGKLGDPAAVRAIRAMVAELRASRSPGLARDREDRLQLEAGLVELLETLQKHPDAQLAITKKTGVALTDMDQDGVFDTPEQLDAVYRTALEEGLHSGGRAILPRHRVRGLLWRSPDGERVATKLDLRIPGTRSQERIALASGAVNPLVKSLGARLRELDPDAKAVFTGQPIARQATLDAVMSAFRFSLLVALGLCFLLAAIFMRSIRYALVSVVPILLVVAWLNAFMFLAGYNLNVVTATIGAISIGVGIDFAVHFVMRFQQELRRGAPCEPALAVTGASTGGALMGSALSSVVGFAILAFAPMPMFSSFGLLTAVMILMAAVATLLVLPSLLLLVTPKRRPGGESPPQA